MICNNVQKLKHVWSRYHVNKLHRSSKSVINFKLNQCISYNHFKIKSLLSIKDVLKKSNFVCLLELKVAHFCISLSERSRKFVMFTGKIIYISLFAFVLLWHQHQFYQTFQSISSFPSPSLLKKVSRRGSSLQGYSSPHNAGVGFCDKSGEIYIDSNTNNKTFWHENRFEDNDFLTPRKDNSKTQSEIYGILTEPSSI